MSTQANKLIESMLRDKAVRRARQYLAASVLALTAGVLAPAVMAADNEAAKPAAPEAARPMAPQLSPEQRALMEDFQQTRAALMKTGRELGAIEKQAYDKNPALVKQRDALRDAIRKKMTTKDYNAKAKYDELKSMVEKIQGEGNADPAARQKDIVAFRQAQQEFMMRQRLALEDKGIKKKVEKLQKDVRADMIKINPKVKAMFASMEKDQKHMRALQQKAMEMHQEAVQKAPPQPAAK